MYGSSHVLHTSVTQFSPVHLSVMCLISSLLNLVFLCFFPLMIFFERDIERERESEKKDRERGRGLPFADHAPDAPSSQSWKHKTPSTLQQDL